MVIEAFLQVLLALALPGAGAWVRFDTIGGLRVQFFSGRSVPSGGHILLHTGVDSRSFRLFAFPSQSWGCDP